MVLVLLASLQEIIEYNFSQVSVSCSYDVLFNGSLLFSGMFQ